MRRPVLATVATPAAVISSLVTPRLRLTLRMQPVGGSAVTLRPTVVEVVDGHRLRWQGRVGVRGLFDADHLFIVEPRGPAGRDSYSKSSSAVCSCRSFSGRWTAAHCRRSTR
jgi:hypothetical protein